MDRYNLAEEWRNWRPAMLASILCNINRDPKTQAYKPDDFMPKAKKPKKKQPVKEQIKAMKMLNTIRGGEKNNG